MLTISINSFSYKNSYPKDESAHGGGFVFDCRGLPNPGRLDAYKSLTGNDKEIIKYLENLTVTQEFLEGIQKVISICIDNYIEREFLQLSISFGCTGGQHRSVFCANAIKAFIVRKYPQTEVDLRHLELE